MILTLHPCNCMNKDWTKKGRLCCFAVLHDSVVGFPCFKHSVVGIKCFKHAQVHICLVWKEKSSNIEFYAAFEQGVVRSGRKEDAHVPVVTDVCLQLFLGILAQQSLLQALPTLKSKPQPQPHCYWATGTY